jgi:hypothetical protein
MQSSKLKMTMQNVKIFLILPVLVIVPPWRDPAMAGVIEI